MVKRSLKFINQIRLNTLKSHLNCYGRGKTTSKVGFLAWEMWWNKVLTMDQLKRTGFPLYGGAEEDLNHLLIHCPMIWELWGALLLVSGTAWVCPLLARDLIVSWKAILTRKEDWKVWLATPLYLL